MYSSADDDMETIIQKSFSRPLCEEKVLQNCGGTQKPNRRLNYFRRACPSISSRDKTPYTLPSDTWYRNKDCPLFGGFGGRGTKRDFPADHCQRIASGCCVVRRWRQTWCGKEGQRAKGEAHGGPPDSPHIIHVPCFCCGFFLPPNAITNQHCEVSIRDLVFF